VQLSSFTATIIILNSIVGSGWNFTWSLLTCCPTLGYNCRSIEVQEGIAIWVNKSCMNFVIYFLFMWTSYLARILFLKGCGSLFWESPNSSKIFNGLQNSFHVWQWFINVSESFSYKDSIFILATKRKEDFRINSTFRFHSPSLYGTSKEQQIWSYHI
jgi:hypothetical protein